MVLALLIFFVGLPVGALWLRSLWSHPVLTIFATLILVGLIKDI